MPKQVDPAAKRTEQVLLRLTADELEWLDSAAHLERVSVNAYVYRLVGSHARALQSNEHVAADVRNRRAYEGSSSAATPMSSRRLDTSFAEPNDDVAVPIGQDVARAPEQ